MNGSSNVEKVSYNPSTRILNVQFRGGREYHYHEIGPDLAAELQAAESPGRYVNRVLRKDHSHCLECAEDDS